jgi:chromosome segregation ATPase
MTKLGKNAVEAIHNTSEPYFPTRVVPNQNVQQQKMEDLQMKLLQSQSDVEYLTKLTEKLQANMPDLPNIVATMLARERQEHDRKDQKVLEMLRTKDEKLQTLTAELDASQLSLKETNKQLKQARYSLASLENKYAQVSYYHKTVF